MKIIINRNGDTQKPKIIIDTEQCTYPHAIRSAIELALRLDGFSAETINEVFGIFPDTTCEE